MKSGQHAPYSRTSPAALAAAVVAILVSSLAGAQSPAIPPSFITPDKVTSRIGTLEFKDGAPSKATTDKIYDTLDFTHAYNVFVNTMLGRVAATRRGKGFQSIGVKDNESSSSPS